MSAAVGSEATGIFAVVPWTIVAQPVLRASVTATTAHRIAVVRAGALGASAPSPRTARLPKWGVIERPPEVFWLFSDHVTGPHLWNTNPPGRPALGTWQRSRGRPSILSRSREGSCHRSPKTTGDAELSCDLSDTRVTPSSSGMNRHPWLQNGQVVVWGAAGDESGALVCLRFSDWSVNVRLVCPPSLEFRVGIEDRV